LRDSVVDGSDHLLCVRTVGPDRNDRPALCRNVRPQLVGRGWGVRECHLGAVRGQTLHDRRVDPSRTARDQRAPSG
jgi:hypothetical protein